MVITGFFSYGSFEKRLQLSPSRISFCIPMTISSLIFPRTGCVNRGYMSIHNTGSSSHDITRKVSVHNILCFLNSCCMSFYNTEGSLRNLRCKSSLCNILCIINGDDMSILSTESSFALFTIFCVDLLCEIFCVL